MAINEKVYIGSVDTPTLSFDQNNIEDILCNNDVNLIGDELSSDVLEVTVFFADDNNVLKTIPYATPIFYYTGENLVGKYYISKVERKGVKKYLIRSTSLIGLIEKEEFYGGYYTSETFEDVLYDVLLTNGIETDKYDVYAPVSLYNASTYGTNLLNEEESVEQWKYRMHLEFTLVSGGSPNPTFTKSDTIAGDWGMYYAVNCGARKNSADQSTFWYISVFYNYSTYDLGDVNNPLFGDGTKVTVDVVPGDKIEIRADYIKYDDPSVTGTVSRKWTNVRVPSTTRKMYLGYIFGTSVAYNLQIKWDAYKVYNANGDIVIDGVFVRGENDNNYYVVNAAEGRKKQTTYFNPYGDSFGVVSDFSRVERSLELYNNIEYGDGISSILVRGWIKNITRREALHQLLFATNVSMLKTADGKFLFTRISDFISGEISDDSLYDDSQEEVINQAKKISVKEFYYETGDGTSQKIFDNSAASAIEGRYVAIFDKAPAYNITAGTGITIIASNCNAAIVTGRGTITGAAYNQYSNAIEFKNQTVLDGADVSVNNIGLITSVNSDSVLNKLKAYYSGSLTKVQNSILYNGERCGLKYSFNTLYGIKQAFLTSYKARSSAKIKSTCVFIAGFIPSDQSGYTSFFIGTYSEEWTVPSSVRTSGSPNIRLNIIGSGSDGTAGSRGSDGQSSPTGSGTLQGGNGGEGGAGGTGGNGGKIYSLTVDVTNINKIVVTQSRTETIVSTYNDSNTLVSTYSSASGNRRDAGFTNVFTGLIYARKGLDGFSGGDGGKGGYTDDQINFVEAVSGEDVDVYSGGVSFHGIITPFEDATGTAYFYDSFGGGGGASYGNNGGNSSLPSSSIGRKTTVGGYGANAIVPPSIYEQYGSGGFGGNGGGGGGGAGTSVYLYTDGSGQHFVTASQNIGTGGNGSSGTPGIDGCIIVYY